MGASSFLCVFCGAAQIVMEQECEGGSAGTEGGLNEIPRVLWLFFAELRTEGCVNTSCLKENRQIHCKNVCICSYLSLYV